METCKIYYCYKATNTTNQKVYIGFAADPQKRWSQHKADALSGRGYVFHQAIRKHGWDAFKFEILCCGKNKRDMLEYVEPALIEQYQSRIGEHGYNMHKKVFGASSRFPDKRQRRQMTNEERKRHQAIFDRPEVRQTMKDHHWKRRDPEAQHAHMKMMSDKTNRQDPIRRKKQSMTLTGRKQEPISCPKCGKTGGNTMRQWHFENCGRKLSKENKEKLIRSRLGKHASEETRNKLRNSHLGHVPTEQTRGRLSEAHRQFSPEQLDDIRNLVEQGIRIVIIAEKFGTTRQTINRLRRSQFKYFVVTGQG
jgi:group I intron endonuclease